MILAGEVKVNGHVVDKPGTKIIPSDSSIEIKERPRFVSRGGLKLERALEAFKIDVSGVVAMDVGSSTGGFTDCLLQRGASRVYAFDVGTNQMVWKLRQDRRVHLREQFKRPRSHFLTISESRSESPSSTFRLFLCYMCCVPPCPYWPRAVRPFASSSPSFELARERVGKGASCSRSRGASGGNRESSGLCERMFRDSTGKG